MIYKIKNQIKEDEAIVLKVIEELNKESSQWFILHGLLVAILEWNLNKLEREY